MEWIRKVVVVSVCALGTAGTAKSEGTTPIVLQTDYVGVPDSLLDIVIEWIEEWFAPESEEETPPAEEDTW
ncbi:MAG: hypothetical protein AAFR96_06495 [Planctomycetota bacterium]